MASDDLRYLTITELEPLIATGQVSPVELLEECLTRIHSLDGELRAFITLTESSARQAALMAETAIIEGEYQGPLHGIPLGLKDLYHIEGVATTAGSKIMAGFVPKEDATSVGRLKGAGVVVVGKLNMHPFAYGAVGLNPDYGDPRNPWDRTRIAGGSSSGSGVALAAGMLPAATGSDTGGSIRIPASLCGVVGIKPTYGRISRQGIIPLSWSLDHAGPMARCVEDCAILLEAMAGEDPKDSTSSSDPVPDFRATLRQPITDLRAGVPKQFFSGIQDGVRDSVNQAIQILESLGVKLVEIDVPSMDEAAAISMGILGPEVATYHKDIIAEHASEYPEDIRRRILPNLFIPAVDYIRAMQMRTSFTRRYYEVFDTCDFLVTPTEPMTAQPIGQTTIVIDGEERNNQGLLTRFTSPFNIAGLPAISVPCGYDHHGLPVGLQIVGKPFDESTVLQVAYAYEQATEWHARRPTL